MIANTVAIAASTAPGTTVFSGYLTNAGLTAAPSKIQISATQQISLGLPANQNVGATSAPAGTGNAISDILRSLAVVANSSTAISSNPRFFHLDAERFSDVELGQPDGCRGKAVRSA